MPNAPRRPCVHAGCPHLQPCPVHVRHARTGQTYAERLAREPWRALYKTARWVRRRKAFLADHPLCVECAVRGLTKLATTPDHRLPHRGDETLFWDETNWQALCASCHSAKTATEVWR